LVPVQALKACIEEQPSPRIPRHMEDGMNPSYHSPAPEMVPLPRAPGVFGLSRSRLYLLAAEGRIRMVKCGSRTLVDAASVRGYLATLPAVTLRGATL
jgi:hypothetical protein